MVAMILKLPLRRFVTRFALLPVPLLLPRLLRNLLLLLLLLSAWLSVPCVEAAITDAGQLEAIAAMTNPNNFIFTSINTTTCATSPSTYNRRIVCNVALTQILEVYCYNQGSDLSFTLPPALSGLTYMTKM